MSSIIEPLFDLIPKYPGLNIAVICHQDFTCIDSLSNFCTATSARLHVKLLKDEPTLQIPHEHFSFEQEAYNKAGVQYDYLFVCADIMKEKEPLKILNRIYRALKNGAHLFAFYAPKLQGEFIETLESSNFVAINPIELSEDVYIISAKKMHGWTRV